MPTFQTLSDFLRVPFNDNTSPNIQRMTEYENAYNQEKSKIKLNAHTKIDESYYFHVLIPSASQKASNVYYDVVIRFFTSNSKAKKSSHLRDYYIQFFSNSPSFIYKYAVVYKNEGFLINELYEKLDPRFFDKLPEKRNPKYELSFDKSIYFACRFLNDRKFRVLTKVGIPLGRSLSPLAFFKEIKDFQTIRYESELLNLEKKSIRALEKAMKEKEESEKKRKLQDSHRKFPSLSTSHFAKRIRGNRKKTAVGSTSKITRVIKKTARKQTTKDS